MNAKTLAIIAIAISLAALGITLMPPEQAAPLAQIVETTSTDTETVSEPVVNMPEIPEPAAPLEQ